MEPRKIIIPRGPAKIQINRGPVGADGPAATLTIGAVTTGAPGTDAGVSNSGTSSAAVLDFVIPRGDVGERGETGDRGPIGLPGTTTWGGITDKPVTLSGFGITDAVHSSLLASPSGVATLDAGGKLAASQLPDIAIVDYLGAVSSQAAMLALTGQKGDWVTRTDLGSTWIITGNNPAVIGGWTQLSYPTAPVTSVSGKTGAVTLTRSDVGLGNVDNTADLSKPVSTAQAAADSSVATVAANALSTHASAGGIAHPAATTSAAGFQSAADKVKLNGIATGATANSADATLLDRANHTGTQAPGTVTGLVSELSALSSGITTAQSDISAHKTNTGNPHAVTKAQVGLGSADNTSDANKPVSTLAQAALDKRVRVDAAQAFSSPEKTQGLANMGVTLSGGGAGNADIGKVPVYSIQGSLRAGSFNAVRSGANGMFVLTNAAGDESAITSAGLTSSRTFTLPDRDCQLAADADVVKITGNQTIAGNKTFTGQVIVNQISAINGNRLAFLTNNPGAGAAVLGNTGGASSYAAFDVLDYIGTQMGGFGYANPSAGAFANSFYVYSVKDLFLQGGMSTVKIVASSGNLLVGTFTDDGVNKLQVAGGVAADAHLHTASSVVGVTSSRNLVLGDNGRDLIVTGTSAIVLTLPSGLAAGFRTRINNDTSDTGSVKVVVSGASINSNTLNGGTHTTVVPRGAIMEITWMASNAYRANLLPRCGRYVDAFDPFNPTNEPPKRRYEDHFLWYDGGDATVPPPAWYTGGEGLTGCSGGCILQTGAVSGNFKVLLGKMHTLSGDSLVGRLSFSIWALVNQKRIQWAVGWSSQQTMEGECVMLGINNDTDANPSALSWCVTIGGVETWYASGISLGADIEDFAAYYTLLINISRPTSDKYVAEVWKVRLESYPIAPQLLGITTLGPAEPAPRNISLPAIFNDRPRAQVRTKANNTKEIRLRCFVTELNY